MKLLYYTLNDEINADEVAELRLLVGWDPRRDKLAKILSASYLYATCRIDGKLVGYVDVLSDRVEDALIRSLMVHPEFQRLGIAVRLLKMVIDRIKADGIKTINVLFEPELADLYRQAGFKIVGGGLIDTEIEGV